MYRCESWTIKKAECWRIDTFELWYWRRLLKVLWTARRSNQSILKEFNPEYSLEGLMQKLQYFGHLMWRADSLEKTLILGKVESKRRRGSQRMKWLDSITDSMDMSLSKLRETVDRGAWYAVVHRVAKSQTWLSDWTPTRGTKIPHAQEQKKPCTAKKTQSSQKKHVHIYTGGGGGIPIIIYGLFPLFMNNHCCLLASAFSQTFSCHFNWLTSLIFLMSLNYSFVKSKPLKPQSKFSTVWPLSPNPSFPTQAPNYLQISCCFPTSTIFPYLFQSLCLSGCSPPPSHISFKTDLNSPSIYSCAL